MRLDQLNQFLIRVLRPLQQKHRLLDRFESFFLFLLRHASSRETPSIKNLFTCRRANLGRYGLWWVWSAAMRCRVWRVLVEMTDLVLLELFDCAFQLVIKGVLPNFRIWIVVHGTDSQNSISGLRRKLVFAYSRHYFVYRSIWRCTNQDLSLFAGVDHRNNPMNRVSLTSARLKKNKRMR